MFYNNLINFIFFIVSMKLFNANNQNVTGLIDNLLNKSQVETLNLIKSDADLFAEFETNLINEIYVQNLEDHINEHLIYFEIDKTLKNFELDRNSFKESIVQYLSKLKLKMNNNSTNDIINYLKAISTDYIVKKQEELYVLIEIFQYHVSHSEIHLNSNEQIKQKIFIGILKEKTSSLQNKLLKDHLIMYHDMMQIVLLLESSVNNITNQINSVQIKSNGTFFIYIF